MTIEADRASDTLIARALGETVIEVWAVRYPDFGELQICPCDETAGDHTNFHDDGPVLVDGEIRRPHEPTEWYSRDYATQRPDTDDGETWIQRTLVPAYTTDPAAMLALVAEMRARGWNYLDVEQTPPGAWVAKLADIAEGPGGHDYDRRFTANCSAPTAPLAVARAAYAALTA